MYDIVPLDKEDSKYKVYSGKGADYNHAKSYVVNIDSKICTCGHWQDTELLCVHAMCYVLLPSNQRFIF